MVGLRRPRLSHPTLLPLLLLLERRAVLPADGSNPNHQVSGDQLAILAQGSLRLTLALKLDVHEVGSLRAPVPACVIGDTRREREREVRVLVDLVVEDGNSRQPVLPPFFLPALTCNT